MVSGRIDADFVIGADGATSTMARTAGLVDPARVLWGFAVRGYLPCRRRAAGDRAVERPTRRGFPGYGWLFPGPEGANLGLGIGLGHSRLDSRTGPNSNSTNSALISCASGYSNASHSAVRGQLGGWLKMGARRHATGGRAGRAAGR